MKARLLSFGRLEVDGREFDHDVVIEGGAIRKRKKGPSKPLRDRYGHTPLSAEEEIPWSRKVLVIGIGAQGQLPVMDEVYEEADRRGIRIVARTTAEACRLINEARGNEVAAILHVTC
jgi:hypothetical protein